MSLLRFWLAMGSDEKNKSGLILLARLMYAIQSGHLKAQQFKSILQNRDMDNHKISSLLSTF
ncbi:hypothetical protein YC2023_059733 [Brassica napus]